MLDKMDRMEQNYFYKITRKRILELTKNYIDVNGISYPTPSQQNKVKSGVYIL